MSTARGADLLVLSAHAPELVGLRDALGPGLAGVVRGLRVVCATVGVGLPAAGAGTMRQVRDSRARAVVLVGSCGAYAGVAAPSLLDLVVAEQIHLVDPSALRGKSEFPAPMQTQISADEALSAGLVSGDAHARRAHVATTLAITTDDALAARMGRRSGCAVENLEAFAIGLACASLGLPFAAVLAVTNVVGVAGRKQWQKHQRTAAEDGGRLVLDWLHRGARGLPSR